MLDDHTSRAAPGKLRDAFVGGVGVVDVVVGELLALYLPCGRDTWTLLGCAIERRALVRILAVAQRLGELAAERPIGGRDVAKLVCEPVRDRRIVGSGASVGLLRQRLAQGKRGGAAILFQFVEHTRVIVGVDHDRHVIMVLRRGTDHRRAADVDILDAVVEGRAFRDGRLERIEIDHQQVDRCDAVLLHRRRMLCVFANRQQPAMHLRMQRLDAPVHHFGKPGQVGDVAHCETCLRNRLCGAPG